MRIINQYKSVSVRTNWETIPNSFYNSKDFDLVGIWKQDVVHIKINRAYIQEKPIKFHLVQFKNLGNYTSSIKSLYLHSVKHHQYLNYEERSL